jgi:hypothetical protein
VGTSPIRWERWTALAAVIAFAAILLRTAWICDDAYITFRMVDNVIAGFGPRWNVAERVQGYAHPRWMLLLLPDVVVRETCFSAIGLSLVCSLAAVGRSAPSRRGTGSERSLRWRARKCSWTIRAVGTGGQGAIAEVMALSRQAAGFAGGPGASMEGSHSGNQGRHLSTQ